VCIVVTLGSMEETLLSLDCEVKLRICFIKCLFIVEPEGDIKESSVNCTSLYRSFFKEPECGFVYRVI